MKVARAVLIAAAFASCASLVRADVLADMKHSLATLRAKQPMHAVIDVVRARHSKGRFLNDDFEGSATIDVGTDAAAIHVTVQRALLDRADTNRPTAMTLTEVAPVSIENALDFSMPLLRLISGGRVVEDRAVMYEGRAVRLLRLQLAATARSEDATAPNISDDSITIWVGEGAVPVAAKHVRKGTAGILLVRIDTVRTESWKFASYGDHLVALRFEDRSIVSGSLQRGDASTVWTVRSAEVTQ